MPTMAESVALNRFWWRWVGANAVAEFVGLGVVALAGFVVAPRLMQTPDALHVVAFAAFAVGLGAFEGAVVGWAQAQVLRRRLPALRGWVRATVLGAMTAWAVGMLPSTLVKLSAAPGGAPAAKPALVVILLLAAGMGAVAGPILAAFQWRSLRGALANGSLRWLPANAAAWAAGMPLIFLGIQAHEVTHSALLVALAIALSLLAAGAVVGAIHGLVLIGLLRRQRIAERGMQGHTPPAGA